MARDQAQDASLLYQLSKELLQYTDYDQMLDCLVKQSLSILGGDRGFLVLLQGESYDLKVVKNWSPEEYEGGREPISRTIIAEVIEHGAPLLIEDATQDRRFEMRQSVRDLVIRSVLVAPLSIEGQIAGVLYLESRSNRHFFTEQELSVFTEIIELAGRILGVSLQRFLLEERNQQLERELSSRPRIEGIFTQDPNFLSILESVTHVASSDIPVLIQGQSGTGKELIARALHQQSPRAKQPFLTINCGAISANLLESELFGHVKGAFTGAFKNKAGLVAVAHKGTLFLDEIGELPRELQAKLLRTLQFGEIQPVGSTQSHRYDVRFVAATNRDLELEAKEGRFREDLLFRLNTVTIHLPTLRERAADILPLFYFFLDRELANLHRARPSIDPNLEKLLTRYHWPGNIRELENEVRRLLALCPGQAPLSSSRLSPRILAAQYGTAEAKLPTLAENEKELILKHLTRAAGNRTHAAESLGVSREGLRNMMKRHNIS
jgi:transcriptional regulator with GAF, ATPase, and Fis domain